MMSATYYNEFEPYAAAWLRNLIAAGHLPAGDVDERSIVDVRGDDLRGYGACHFFAGIGGWPYALRLAAVPDEAPIWTGSCPCQPFSVAGKGEGEDSGKHLWPAFRHLIAECGPPVVFGEQVASKAGRLWLAGVRVDLEALGYAVGAADLCAAGVSAPHIRQRLFWVAESDRGRQRAQFSDLHGREPNASGGSDGVANADSGRRGERDAGQRAVPEPDAGRYGRLANATLGGLGADGRASGQCGHAHECGQAGGLAHSKCDGRGADEPLGGPQGGAVAGRIGPWDNAVLIPCGDGKARRIEPGLPPLAHGVPGRVGRLRAYGNAIVPPLAAEFVKAALAVRP